MKKKKLLFLLLLLCMIATTACSNASPQKDLGELYSLALDEFIPIDSALNDGMEYIAIDMTNLTDLDETDKEQILNYFSKYNVKVMEATYEQLVEQGLSDPDSLSLYGILLKVDKVTIEENKLFLEGSKYRSGLGAIGMEVTVTYKNGKWNVESKSTWIS